MAQNPGYAERQAERDRLAAEAARRGETFNAAAWNDAHARQHGHTDPNDRAREESRAASSGAPNPYSGGSSNTEAVRSATATVAPWAPAPVPGTAPAAGASASATPPGLIRQGPAMLGAPVPSVAGVTAPRPGISAPQMSALRDRPVTAFQEANPAGGFGPYGTAEAPVLGGDTLYEDAGRLMRKAVDQFGNEYFEDIGVAPVPGAPPAPQQPAPPPADAPPPTQPAAAAPAPGAPAPGAAPAATPASPAAAAPAATPVAAPVQAGMETLVVTGADGKATTVQVPAAVKQEFLAMKQAEAEANRKAKEFEQGIATGKLDIERMNAEWAKAYQEALLKQGDAKLAQEAAQFAMQQEYQRQVLELQRLTQQMTVGLERERLDVQRRAGRSGGRRRVQAVRYR